MLSASQSAAVTPPASGTKPFAELLREHQGMVFSIAFHCLLDRAAAEEIAQDVFLELYRRLGDLESDTHVLFWLRRVTSNRCIDYARKRKLRATIALDAAPEPSVKAPEADPFLQRKLWAVVASLPETQRVITVLRYQEEMMPEEIARTLDMRVRTVKSHLSRSLASLRQKLTRSMGSVR
jgi:RNA polymerase sigma-70 factor (ECF subfamily)